MRTGGCGGRWVDLERPKPQPVGDIYRHWGSPPPEPSARCLYWAEQVRRGWRPNRRIQALGREDAASWYGVYLWEYIHILWPMTRKQELVR